MTESHMVAIVDDDEAVRVSTARLLQRAGYRVHTYVSGDEFLTARLPAQLGCVLLDVRMPGTDGLAVMRKLADRNEHHAIVVLTGHGDIALAVDAMRLGAVDFLEKPYDPATLIEGIEKACSHSARIAEREVASHEAREKVATLSERQREVLSGILRGKQNKIIAYELDLSIRTVEAYRAQLLTKLGVRGTADAVRLALAAGMNGD